MGNIVTVASGKGGCSKSTTVMILSANLAARGYRVAVIDADRNQSFASWHAQAYEGPPFTCRSEVDHIKVVDLAGELAENHDAVIVDTAGFENLTAASAIGMADHVLIPCMPDRGSVRETMRTAQQVASLSKAARRTIPYSVLLTRWKPRGLSERAALDSLEEEKLPILVQSFGDLADFTKLSFSGTVPTTGKVGDQAGSLIAELVAKGAIPLAKASRVRGKAA
ncbi:ParA family protein [Falsiroseomonas sp. E2-1-a20]|uniref:ParA family protein n=1 Tax=Falsiroseomonas sp. E2-1-a20 TaxID=3239300 RepID=UPI003F39A8B0